MVAHLVAERAAQKGDATDKTKVDSMVSKMAALKAESWDN